MAGSSRNASALGASRRRSAAGRTRSRRAGRSRVSSVWSASASSRSAQSPAWSTTSGSFSSVRAWAGTFETLRRPIVENGTGASKARNIGVRKLRRTLQVEAPPAVAVERPRVAGPAAAVHERREIRRHARAAEHRGSSRPETASRASRIASASSRRTFIRCRQTFVGIELARPRSSERLSSGRRSTVDDQPVHRLDRPAARDELGRPASRAARDGWAAAPWRRSRRST